MVDQTSDPLHHTQKMLLHGEQYLEIHSAPSVNGTLRSKAYIVEVLDKGKSAAITVGADYHDLETGRLVYVNHSTYIIRGSGGFGGRTKAQGTIIWLQAARTHHCSLPRPQDRGKATASYKPPARQPDVIVEQYINENAAALYR